MKPSALGAALTCACLLLSSVWGNAINYVDEGCECAAKPSPSLVRWDKLFIMLEKSQKREAMMLEAMENMIRSEMQNVQAVMEESKHETAQRLDRTLRDASREFLSHIDIKLQSETNGKFDKIERLLGKLVTDVQAISLELLRITQESSTESPAAHDPPRIPPPSHIAQTLGVNNLALSEERVMWSLALFPPPGCFMTLHFPMRSRTIAVGVDPGVRAELRAVTLCLWARPSEPLSKTVLASYGDKSSPRLLQLYLSGDRAVFSVAGDDAAEGGGRAEAAGAVNRDAWAHYCGAWESESGDLTLWVNGQLTAHNGSPVARGFVVPPGGVLQLGQEKNGCCAGGGFDPELAFAGALAGFNVWDHVLPSEEIAKLAGGRGGCRAQGNVVAWGVSELHPVGGAVFNLY
ncbi:pentraxin-related protein PTX3 [Lethenteron reissneri]|uniref:pentraxin-related protein PTX3 n=1 Tax=Lethenteron reissneri TaxID=7753 RepID=UPI002AB7D389|nr:pentraxin-related protein PTX3 [Lethenteron reissneri]